MRALVAGWFSFEVMGATAGDLIAAEIAGEWLQDAGYEEVVVARAAPFADVVDWKGLDPADLDLVVFVCGPFGNGWPLTEFLGHFEGSKLVGVNVSMLEPVERWNPFDALFERDSSVAARPDVCFLSHSTVVPVVGVILVHRQREYAHAAHDAAEHAIRQLLHPRAVAAIDIETRLDLDEHARRTPAQIESLVARMDAVVTTRLHGLVLALKNGVPALAVDPISGGAKVTRQAETIGWPACFSADALDPYELESALDWCLAEAGRDEARACAARAREVLTELPAEFVRAVGG
jgi:Polysaccharide pyruvyl transferase